MRRGQCSECRFWEPTPLDGEPIEKAVSGECHRRAPVAIPLPEAADRDSRAAWIVWPETTRGEWCGEFEVPD